MLIWGTGFNGMKVANNQAAAFAQLGWYGLPGGPLSASMNILSTGRFGSNCLNMVNSNVSGLETQASYLFKGAYQFGEGFTGMALYVPSGEDTNSQPFFGFGMTGVCQVCAVFKAFGVIELWRGRPGKAGATLLATSPAGSYLTNTWNYVELGGLLAISAAGYFKVRVNTVEVISVVSTHTSIGVTCNSWMYGYARDNPTGVGGGGALLCAVYVTDTAGVDNTSWLGNVDVPSQMPAGAGSSTDWSVTGAASNWQGASNQNIDDTKYVYTPTINDLDQYTITPLLNAPAVFGVQVTGFYRQDAATQRSAANVITSGGTQDQGADFFMGGNYAAQTDMWERDPDTALPWIYTAVNTLEIGPKVTS